MGQPRNCRRVRRWPIKPTTPAAKSRCRHPSDADLCRDYAELVNTGRMPDRLLAAKSCGECWFRAARLFQPHQ